jgi:uncharacterized protein (DUF302 family)
MKTYIPALLAALVATSALANPQPVPQPVFPAMMPGMPQGYSPYMMMPYGMSAPQMQMQQLPYPMPMPFPVTAAPAPAPASADPFSALSAAMANALNAGAAAPAVPMAPAPAPIAAAAPAPVASPFPTFALPDLSNVNTLLPNIGFNPLLLLNNVFQPANKTTRPYEMRRIIEQPEKTAMIQTMLPLTTGLLNMGMGDAMNYFAYKVKAKPGLSFEEVRESLMLRANQVNMKFVGDNQMWKDFHAVLDDKTAPRIEVLSFCDIAVARDLLKISPEFVVFLPCRIAIMEDADKNIWLLMVDWNMDWVKGYESKLGLTPELMKGAESINKRMVEMIQAASIGDL